MSGARGARATHDVFTGICIVDAMNAHRTYAPSTSNPNAVHTACARTARQGWMTRTHQTDGRNNCGGITRPESEEIDSVTAQFLPCFGYRPLFPCPTLFFREVLEWTRQRMQLHMRFVA